MYLFHIVPQTMTPAAGTEIHFIHLTPTKKNVNYCLNTKC